MAKLSWMIALVVMCCSLLAIGGTPITAAAQLRPRVIFVHHSVGANLISQGNVRSLLADKGFDFWDHGYNGEGLFGSDGKKVEPGFDVLDDNTDPEGYDAIFSQPVHNPPDNTLSYLLTYDVIVFKSCYPVSDIDSDSKLASYKEIYLRIRTTMDQFPDRLFVVVTPPPNPPYTTQPDRAERGREFANWLKSDDYVRGHPNVVTFDLFDNLADSNNYLRDDYQQTLYPIEFTSLDKVPGSLLNVVRTLRNTVLRRPLYSGDPHPNLAANRKVGPAFVESITKAYGRFNTR